MPQQAVLILARSHAFCVWLHAMLDGRNKVLKRYDLQVVLQRVKADLLFSWRVSVRTGFDTTEQLA